ncbi:MAG: hypothetical protein IJ159_02575 [Prevotella sp.]|nr:hypothetical protein [Prevotella sp.]
MKKFFQFALMAAMMLPSALVLNACGDDDDDNGDSGTIDTRLEKVIPNEYRKQMEKYMTIYDGVNPPNVEGIYVMSKGVNVYDSEGYYDPGDEVTDTYMNLSNQNMTNNTIDYKERQGSDTSQTGNGAFISGEGNNFSIYFNTSGNSHGVTFKLALVVSGTKTSDGIRNLFYAFVMTEKGADPDKKVMAEGGFRVFKDGDGLASNAEWPSSTRIAELMDGNSDLVKSLISNK